MDKKMMAEIDIENSQTQKVITIKVPIITFDDLDDNIFDISSITEEEKKLLIDAINPKLEHTDIELFYVDYESDIPNFGPDYSFRIENDKLYAINERIKLIGKRKK